MERQLDIKEIERNAYSPLHNDGVEDILAGTVLFTFGAILNVERPIAPYLIVFLPLLAWFVRQFVTYPRIGYLKPFERRPHARIGVTLMLVSGLAATWLLALLIFITPSPPPQILKLWPVGAMHSALGALLVVLLLGMGIYSGMMRWYVYAVLAGAAGWLTIFLRDWLPVDGIAAASVLITAWGIIMLARFVRKYPVRDKEVVDEPAAGDAK